MRRLHICEALSTRGNSLVGGISCVLQCGGVANYGGLCGVGGWARGGLFFIGGLVSYRSCMGRIVSATHGALLTYVKSIL